MSSTDKVRAMLRMNPLDLIHIQLELECIGTDANNVLFRIPGDNPDDMARFYAAHHAAGYVAFVRHDVDSRIAESLRALAPQQAFENVELVKRILYGETPRHISVSAFRSYYFPNAPSPDASVGVVRRGDRFVVLVGSEPVSWAWSSRSNSRASELATETKPDFRRRNELEQGKIAFYSHRQENVASQVLATSLGVIHFVDGVNYE